MEKGSTTKKPADRKSLWYFVFMMASFVLINTFFLDTSPRKDQEMISESRVNDFPVTHLKNTLGHVICSSVSSGDTLITLSGDNLPKVLQNNSEDIHLVQKCSDGILVYSDKISPKMAFTANLQEGDSFYVLSNFNESEPTISTGSYDDGKVSFASSTPESNGLVFVENENTMVFAGLYNSSKGNVKSIKDIEGLDTFTAAIGSSFPSGKEEFYCLENDLMQVVFSNYGGAIAELNLKLNAENAITPVRSISFDKEILEKSPENAMFPINPCKVTTFSGDTINMKSVSGGYTPLLRRTLLRDGKVLSKVPPHLYALAIDNGSKEVQSLSVTKLTHDTIVFKGRLHGKDITRTYSLVKGAPYSLEMNTSMNGKIDNLTITSGVLESEGTSSGNTPALLYFYDNGSKMKLSSFSLPKESTSNKEITPRWSANTNGFFTAIMYPRVNGGRGIFVDKVPGDKAVSRLSLLPVDKPFSPNSNLPGYEIKTPFKPSVSGSPFYFYAGPVDKSILAHVDKTFETSITKTNPEFIRATTVRGWLSFISDPFAKFMNIILNFFYFLTGSWGVAIILLTITLRLILYPFNAKAYKSMLKLKNVGPKQKALEAKYKNDPQRLRMELGMLFRNEGVNPLASILPIFLQIPFFIGMFELLKTKFALRGATFIPGWIENLTAPDVIFSWGTNIPFLGNEFHLLPLIGAIAMHLSQKFSQGNKEPSKNPSDMEKQMKAMGPLLTVVFFFIFYNLASGLNIYLILSSILGVLQQWFVNKQYGDKKSKINVLKN